MFTAESIARDFNNLFAPLDQKYCGLFFYISLYYLVALVFTIFGIIRLFGDNKSNKYILITALVWLPQLIIGYFYNRILFNMCKI
jgi:hypothetical protein